MLLYWQHEISHVKLEIRLFLLFEPVPVHWPGGWGPLPSPTTTGDL